MTAARRGIRLASPRAARCNLRKHLPGGKSGLRPQPLNAFFQKLEARAKVAESRLCVGLDPDPELMPKKYADNPEGVYGFLSEIIGATADYAACYKPNLAFFEALGVEGWHLLAQVMKAVPKDIPVIVDAKRGDIGSTARRQAHAIFDVLGADAVTLNPLMGHDSIEPWLEYEDKGLYLLCITSNPGAKDFEMWFDLYLQVARKVGEWNTAGNCGLVVGATQPMQLANVLMEAPELPLLVPGVGSQGGEIDLLAQAGRGRPMSRLMINVSRGVLYASNKPDFARSARKAAKEYRDRINQSMK